HSRLPTRPTLFPYTTLFRSYKSKYLDLYEKVKRDTAKEKTSILDDIDFELELIHRDRVNVAYILKLLAKLKDTNTTAAKTQKKRSEEHTSELQSRENLVCRL